LILDTTIVHIIDYLSAFLWPFIRVSAFVMVMPVIGGSFVPARVRILLALALTLIIAPTVVSPATEPMSLAGLLLLMREFTIGIIMGFAVQLVFDAIVLGGQVIAMSMGLGFAVFLDQARGVNIPVLGQLFLMLGMLVFLSLDGHLALIQLVADSFHLLPISFSEISADAIEEFLIWSANVFAVGLKIALPAITALLVVNLSFGVMSRAAPTLNLFAVGFPVAMLLGFVVIFLNMGSLQENVSQFSDNALAMLRQLLRGI